MVRIRFWLPLSVCLLAWVTPSSAASTIGQAPWHQAIVALVQQHLPATTTKHHFELITPIAALSSLENCANVAARFTREPQRLAGRTMIELRCNDANGQNPLFVQIDVAVIGEYLVVTRDLAANHTLSRQDITMKQGDLSQLPRYALLATPTEIRRVVGQQLRRSLTQHSVLQENLLTRPNVVNYGDELIIEASGKGFQITRTGEAMDTGSIGDIIRVRLNNRQLLRVEITAAGRARPAQ
ncbi:flagella basal body P-ring formation protein FlgA [Pseudidiomarina andamanensis]|uniref:Flagella basal body P-ring formation protein FlgA n=1 Tax=Pseudidiomarina andamanensis TaxID=1940690 RepID=A0AA92EUY3_9GAMM|nr:flagella basal body P-ring formation protein FlgA [Pseudidiomarina andamanensis]